MPKMKTHKGAAKRVKVTGSGIILRMRRLAGKRIKARTNAKRQNRKPVEVKKSDVKILKKLLPGL
jgi:large subunit ribosomal protein L35